MSVSDSAADVIDLTTDDAANGGPRKRRRVEGNNVVVFDTPAYDFRPGPSPNEQTVTSNGNQETAGESMDTDDADDTDAAEGLDPDGRRSEEECLAIAFEQDADGRMWCTMCK